MKRSFLLIALLIAVPLVLAGESYDLGDFNVEPTQGVWLEPGDEVRFELLGGIHSLFLDAIDTEKDSVDIKVFPFRTTANYITLKKGENNLKTDFNRDGKKELVIKLFDIKEGKALIFFGVLDTSVQPKPTVDTNSNYDEPPEGQGVVKEKSNSIYYIMGAIILLIVLSFYLNLRKAGKKKKK